MYRTDIATSYGHQKTENYTYLQDCLESVQWEFSKGFAIISIENSFKKQR